MGQRTIPSKYLHYNCKSETCYMEYLYRPAPLSYKDTEYQEEDPEKMHKNYTICCYFVKHFYLTQIMQLNNADVVKKFIFRYLDLHYSQIQIRKAGHSICPKNRFIKPPLPPLC